MFTKFFTHYSALSFANGLSIGSTLDQEGTEILAEIDQSALDNLPEYQWATDAETCYSWAIFKDWNLTKLCNEDG